MIHRESAKHFLPLCLIIRVLAMIRQIEISLLADTRVLGIQSEKASSFC